MADTTPLLQADQAASAWQAAYDLVRRSLTTYEPAWAKPPQDSMMLRRFVPTEGVEPVPFGSLADPVSQAAFALAPSVQRGLGAVLPEAGAVGPRLGRPSLLANQRGNLGPPPVSASGEPLPESVVRDEAGQLKRLYHGTTRTFPDFDVTRADPKGLYGPGIYMTESPEVAGGLDGYVTKGLPGGQGALRAAQSHLDNATRSSQIAAKARAAGQTTVAEAWEESARSAEQQAAQFFGAARPNVRPVYADLTRPFDIDATYSAPEFTRLLRAGAQDADTRWYVEDLLAGHGDSAMTGHQLYKALEDVYGTGLHSKADVNAVLQQAGYDGITHIGGANTGTAAHKVVIAFSPDQVYPSFNVDALRAPAPTP